MENKEILTAVLENLDEAATKIINTEVFVGLDGYVDLIQKAVKSQHEDGPEYFATIADFAVQLGMAAGKSAQFELVTQQTKLGGNAPIMAHALGSLGFRTTCLGNFGKESIHEVFQDIHENVTLLSVGDPAMTNALEFNDGKIILSEVGPFKKLDWEMVKKQAGTQALISKINAAKLIALVDWCNLPHSTDIWKGILTELLPEIEKREKFFFFDTADPSRRSDGEIAEMLEVIGGYMDYGFVTLGLNENETEKLYACLCRIHGNTPENASNLIEKGAYIYRNIHVHNLLVHPVDRAISFHKDGVTGIDGRVVKQPKISTGGGDNFNAGYCLGQLSGFDLPQSMVTAMANSGAYVQNGKSPSLQELRAYISKWKSELN